MVDRLIQVDLKIPGNCGNDGDQGRETEDIPVKTPTIYNRQTRRRCKSGLTGSLSERVSGTGEQRGKEGGRGEEGGGFEGSSKIRKQM